MFDSIKTRSSDQWREGATVHKNAFSFRARTTTMRLFFEFALAVFGSYVLARFQIISMPQGGSVSLSMAPLWIFAYRHGVIGGTIAGAASGAMQMFTYGYVIDTIQGIVDYPLAFAMAGVAGLASNTHSIITTIISASLRMICHIVSGVLYFSEYTVPPLSPLGYSMMYNGAFMIPSMAISMAAALSMMLMIQHVRARRYSDDH